MHTPSLLLPLVAVIALSAVHHADSAAMVRFVNMVPAEKAFNALANPDGTTSIASAVRDMPPTASATGGFVKAVNQWSQFPYVYKPYENTVNADRVGLEFLAEGSDGGIVWTESLVSQMQMSVFTATQAGARNKHTAPHYWRNALPPLRGYHGFLSSGSETAAIDRITNSYSQTTGVADTSIEGGNCAAHGASYDCYDQSALKADGIAGLLSFAPGSYRLGAYGVLGDDTGATVGSVFDAPTVNKFTNSRRDVTFEDNKLYTIVAVGQWNFASTSSNTVRLVMFEENRGQTEFGKAAIRFFHGVSTHQSAVDIFSHGNNEAIPANPIFSGLQFGNTSQYTDIAPGILVFPVSQNSARLNTQDVDVSAKLVAGTRATVFCGVTDETTDKVFCRMIPTRVVAYVRLVLDTMNVDLLVPGKFGPAEAGLTGMTVFQSDSYPSAESAADRYAVGESGLRQVIPMINPGEVSKYGEVHIPLFIMDSATSPNVGYSCFSSNPIYSLRCSNTYDREVASPAAEGASYGHFRMQQGSASPPASEASAGVRYGRRYKRVNLLVKTDGMATLSLRMVPSTDFDTSRAKNADEDYLVRDQRTTAADFARNPYYGFTDTQGVSDGGAFLDRFLEPGESYSMYIKPCDRTYMFPRAASSTTTNTVSCPYVNFNNAAPGSMPEVAPAPGGLLAGWSRDRSVSQTFGTDTAGQAYIQFTAIDAQKFTGTIRFTTDNAPGVGSYSTTFTLASTGKAYTDGMGIAGIKGYVDSGRNVAQGTSKHLDVALPATNDWFNLPEGTYTYVFTSSTPSTASAADCVSSIPQHVQVALKAGKRYTLYVLNEYQCSKDKAPIQLNLKSVLHERYGAAGDIDALTGQSFLEESSASTVSSSLVLLAGAIMAVLALLF